MAQHKISSKIMLFLVMAALVCSQNILTTVDFTSNFAYTKNALPRNLVGLSIPYSSILKNITSINLRNLIKFSNVFSTTASSWRVSVKTQWPKGYKLDCPTYNLLLSPITCLRDMLANVDYSAIATFFKGALAAGNLGNLGYDQQKADYRSDDYLNKIFDTYNTQMQSWFGFIVGSSVKQQLYDQADLFEAYGIRQTFTPTTFNEEIILSWYNSYYDTNGPGLSINSSKEWMDTYYNFSANRYGTFTVYAQPFGNITDLTIATLLNESYYRPYLQSRFVGTAGILDTTKGAIGITDLRLVNGDGVSGVTDTMAAAIFAVDFALQSAVFGLSYVLFNNEFSPKNAQSPILNTSNFTPSGTYFGMMMISILNSQQYYFTTQNVTAGSSSNIKVYGFSSFNSLAFVFINKDLNPAASGVVQVNMNTNYYMACMYMSASDLSSKDITIAGYRFRADNTTPQGNFALFNFTPDSTGFKVQLNYSQVAYCYTLVPTYLFTKEDSSATVTTAYQTQEIYLLLLAILILALVI